MCEQNPFKIIPASSACNENKNPKGRPRKLQSVTFSTQPRSMVSQMIEKMITEKKIVLPIEWNSEKITISTLNEEGRISEIDLTEKCLSPKPKNNNFSESMVKMEPKLYSCDFANCFYSSKLSSNLHKHKRTHTGEKPYLCDRCSFRTSFSNSLKVHKRLHTAERPYQCKNCDYRCNSISNLKKHSHIKHYKKKILHLSGVPKF